MYVHHFTHIISFFVLWISLWEDGFCFGQLEFNAKFKLGVNGVIQSVEALSFLVEITAVTFCNRIYGKDLKEGFIAMIKAVMKEISCRTSFRVTIPPTFA